MPLLRLSLLFTIIWGAISLNAIDFHSRRSYDSLSCALKLGYKYVIVRAGRSYGEADKDAPWSLQNAYRAGMKVDIYIQPCRGSNVTVQVYNMMNSFSNDVRSVIGTVWIDLERNSEKILSDACQYESYTPETNCEYVREAAIAIETKGKKVGIYTNKENWQTIFGSPTYCNIFSQYPLWYIHHDGLQSFSDFSPFGGWKAPYLKQIQKDKIVCNMNVNLNWKPDLNQSL